MDQPEEQIYTGHEARTSDVIMDENPAMESSETVVRDENGDPSVEDNLVDFSTKEDVPEDHNRSRRSLQKKNDIQTHVREENAGNESALGNEDWPTLGQPRNSAGFSVSNEHRGHGDHASVGYSLNFQKTSSDAHASSTGDATAHGLPEFHAPGMQRRVPFEYTEHLEKNQATSHEPSELPSFMPTGHLRRPDLDLVQHNPDRLSANGGLDSPLAQFDHDRRRANSQGNIKPRRSRPLVQHIHDLVMWKNTRDSGVVFVFGTVLLLALSFCSLISIFAYLSTISLVLVTTGVVVWQVVQAFQQRQTEHPFKSLLARDVINPEYAHQQLDQILKPMNSFLVRVRNMYLADSMGETLKLLLVMYLLTYVGHWFNLLTLVILTWLIAFSIPKLYSMYKEQVDSVWDTALEGIRDLYGQFSRAVRYQVSKIFPALRRMNSFQRDNNQGRIRSQIKEEKTSVNENGETKTVHKQRTEKLH